MTSSCDRALGKAVCGTFDRWYDSLLPAQQDALLKHLEDDFELIHVEKARDLAREGNL